MRKILELKFCGVSLSALQIVENDQFAITDSEGVMFKTGDFDNAMNTYRENCMVVIGELIVQIEREGGIEVLEFND